jgi:hypothetical protein
MLRLFSKVSSIKLTLKHTHNYGQRKFLGQLKFHYKLPKNGQKRFKTILKLRILKESKCFFNSRESLEAVLALKTEAVRAIWV